jgi:hypothetical protein
MYSVHTYTHAPERRAIVKRFCINSACGQGRERKQARELAHRKQKRCCKSHNKVMQIAFKTRFNLISPIKGKPRVQGRRNLIFLCINTGKGKSFLAPIKVDPIVGFHSVQWCHYYSRIIYFVCNCFSPMFLCV